MIIEPKGIKRNASLLFNQDGACNEIINFRYKDNEWQSIQPGTLKTTFSFFTDGDKLFRHNILPEDLLIYWNHTTGDISTVSMGSASIANSVGNVTSVVKIYEFGIILIFITSNDVVYFKYDILTAAYTMLKPLTHGRYTFKDDNREIFGNTFTPTTDDWVSEGVVKVLERKMSLEKLGKTNGHVFFRVAFKTFDGKFINYSPIFYRNIGYSTATDGTTDPETIPNVRKENVGGVDTYKFSWGEWANIYMDLKFTDDQLSTLNDYAGLISSLCVFMTPPHLDWDANASGAGLINYTRVDGSDTYEYNFYPHSESIEAFFKTNNSFYLVKEISLDQLAGFYLGSPVGGTFTSAYNTAVALPNPPSTIDTVKITRTDYYGYFLYVEDEDYTIDKVGQTIAVLPSRSVTDLDLFIVDDTFPYNLGYKNLIELHITTDDGTDVTTSFKVDMPNGTILIQDLSLLKTSLHAAFTYGMEDGVVYDASYPPPLEGVIDVGDLTLLVTKTDLPIDNFTSHKYFSNIIYEYNSRIHFGDVKTKLCDVPNITVYDTDDQGHLPTGYTAVQDANNQTWTYWVVVTIQTDNGLKKVVTELSNIAVFDDSGDFSCLNQIILYPDQRAKSITILGYDGAYKVVKQTLQLSPHTYGNFAFYTNPSIDVQVTYGATPLTVSKRIMQYSMVPLVLGDEVPTPVHNDIVNDYNRVQASALNNILLFPAKNSYRIGRLSNKITAISSQSMQVSTGQFGEYPLYVGTKEGIFALQQGSGDILYASIQPVSLHSVTQFTNIEGGILFSTQYGLFILSGSQIKQISIPVEGKPETFINALDSFITTSTNIPTVISSTNFNTFLQDAVFAHDPVNNEVYVTESDYTYIYSLLYDIWYKSSEIYQSFIPMSGKIFGVNGTKILDIATPDDSVDVNAWIISRPVKFNSDGLKSIERTILRMIADMDAQSANPLSYHVYGSLNAFEWKLIQGKDYTDFIHSTDGAGKEIILEITNTTARYFIFLLAVKSKVIRLAGFDIMPEPKMANKLR